jgi:hypothetical protein
MDEKEGRDRRKQEEEEERGLASRYYCQSGVTTRMAKRHPPGEMRTRNHPRGEMPRCEIFFSHFRPFSKTYIHI